jgi:hypothetical protein
MSKSTNTVVYFDWKTVIYIYVCRICRTQFISFIGGGNRSILRKPPTCRKSLKTLSHNVVLNTTRLSGIRTHNDCIGSYNSNFHMITTTTAPL